jgi:protein-disulfide isomerase
VIVGPTAADLAAQTKAEFDALKKQVETLQKQVDALTAQAKPPAPSLPPSTDRLDTIKLDRAPIRGSASAPVTMVEVSDFQCPFCGRFFNQTSAQLQKDYVESGRVNYAFLNMPLAVHPNAFDAAEAAACANDQGKFWEMHDRLFSNQALLARPYLVEKSKGLVASEDAYKACFNAGRHGDDIRADVAAARAAGASATPTFFIGSLDAKSRTLKIARRIVGAKPYATFQDALDEVLKNASALSSSSK